jgi:hypothetical protein
MRFALRCRLLAVPSPVGLCAFSSKIPAPIEHDLFDAEIKVADRCLAALRDACWQHRADPTPRSAALVAAAAHVGRGD